MRYWGVNGFLAVVLAGSAGCGWMSSSSATAPAGGVAVVDLDEVAKELGAKARIDDMVKMRAASLKNDIEKFGTEVSADLKGKIEEFKEEYGKELKDLPAEEAQKLRAETLQANAKLQQARTQAQVNLNSFTEELKMAFRRQIRPVAQEVAAKKGFSVVIPKNDGFLLSVDPANDITHDVILALQARNQAQAVTPAPAADSKPAAETTSKPKKKLEKTADASNDKVIE